MNQTTVLQTPEEILKQISPMNSDELFYKSYHQAHRTPQVLKQFLSGLNLEDIRKRHLIVPELTPELIPYIMDDQEYFDENSKISVYFSRHNRYTPAFLHKHIFFEIIYVLHGNCTQTIGVDTLHFHEGDFIFITPGTIHSIEAFDDDSLILNILLRRSTFYEMFSPLSRGNDLLSEFFSSGLYSSQEYQYMALHTDKDTFFRDEFLKIFNEWEHRDIYTDQILVGMLTVIFGHLMRNYADTLETAFSRQNNLPDDFLIMNYIQENLKTVRLADVAEHFNFSVSYCSRLIKSTTGASFNEWKKTLRLRRAESLLINSHYTIAEISDSLGYANPESFIRIFKKVYHTSPSEYRKKKSIVAI